jgi:hypothetical protein
MFFDKLNRLMSGIVGITDFIIDITFLCLFLPKKIQMPADIRTHDPRIRFQYNNIQRASGPTRLLDYAIV